MTKMKQYHVPQFIEVEDKIFGPFTFRQFVYVLGGFALAFILWVFLPKFLAILFGLPVVAFTMALAFYKINNRPFIDVAISAVGYFSKSRLYLWRKEEKKMAASPRADKPLEVAGGDLPRVSRGKLRDLAWSLDVQEQFKNK